MQWAFKIGTERALRGGVSTAITRVSGERAVLDRASRDAVPIATLQQVASTSLSRTHALRKGWMPSIRDNHRPIERPSALAETAQAALNLAPPFISSVMRHSGPVVVKPASPVREGVTGKRNTPDSFDVGRVATGEGAAAGRRPAGPGADKATAVAPFASASVKSTLRTGVWPYRARDDGVLRRHVGNMSGGTMDYPAARNGVVVLAPRVLPKVGGVEFNSKDIQSAVAPTLASANLSQAAIASGGRANPDTTGHYRAAEIMPMAPRIGRGGSAEINATVDPRRDSGDATAFSGGAGRFYSEGDSDAGVKQGLQMSQHGLREASGGTTQGDVFLDGAMVGRWVSHLLTRDAERASVGRTGFDIRRGRLLPGPTVGAS